MKSVNWRYRTLALVAVAWCLQGQGMAIAAPTRGKKASVVRAAAAPSAKLSDKDSTLPSPSATADARPAKETATLLPEIAERMLRAQHADPQSFPKLIGPKGHDDLSHDCLRCHGVNVDAKLPKSHLSSKGSDAWPVESCERCHLWEKPLASQKTGTLALEMPSNGYCLACHGDRTLSMVMPVEGRVSLFVDRDKFSHSVHGGVQMPCVGCHQIKNYPHDRLSAKSMREVERGIERESCYVCHSKETKQFRESVHGTAWFEKGNLDVPGCADCHNFHEVTKTKIAEFRMGTIDTCSRCHGDVKLAAKYKMSPNVTRTYLNDFHGMTVRLTRSQSAKLTSLKPVCYDCHGVHDIKRPSDPNSTVMKERLVVTCQKCHKGAGTNFPAAWMNHYEPSLKKWPIVYLVDLAYKILIPLVMGQFVLYMVLDLYRWAIDRFKKGRRA